MFGIKNAKFQSTRPVRGATEKLRGQNEQLRISIHAPRAGRDRNSLKIIGRQFDISIHAPRAGRDYSS